MKKNTEWIKDLPASSTRTTPLEHVPFLFQSSADLADQGDFERQKVLLSSESDRIKVG